MQMSIIWPHAEGINNVIEEVMPSVATDFAIKEASGFARLLTRLIESERLISSFFNTSKIALEVWSLLSSVAGGGVEWIEDEKEEEEEDDDNDDDDDDVDLADAVERNFLLLWFR